jgi:hypothetical protein
MSRSIFAWSNSLLQRHLVCMGGRRRDTKGRGHASSLGIQLSVFNLKRQRKNPTHESFERKANIKLCRILDLLGLLWSLGDVQCLQILAQMFDLAAANDWEDKRHPEKVICNRNYTITH